MEDVVLMVRAAWLLTLALVGCSLDGLAGGDAGGDAATTTTTTALVSAASSTSSTGGDGGAGGDGDGAAGPGGSGSGGGGAPPTSDLLAWAEGRGSAYAESTLGTDRRLAAIAVDELVVIARVVDDDPEPSTGARRDRLEIVGLDAATGAAAFTLVAPRYAGDDDDAIDLGRLAARGRVVAVPLGFRGTLDVPGGPSLVSVDQDAAVLLFDVDDPAVVTARVVGGTSNQLAKVVAFTTDGDLLVGGRFAQDLTTCPGGGTDLGANRGLVARLDAESGACLRAVHFGNVGTGSLGTGVRGLAVSGDVALASGGFIGNLTLGATTLTSAGDADAFLVRLDVTGAALTLVPGTGRRFGGLDHDLLRDVVAIGGGAFAIAGHTRGGDVGAYCGATALPNTWHAIVLRVGPGGACNWLQALATDGSSGSYGARSLAVAADGGLVVGGAFRIMRPCPTAPTWMGVDADGFVLALDPADGRVTHAARLGAQAEQSATAVAAPGAASEPVVGGSYDQPFDPLLPDPASSDLYVARLLPMPAVPCEAP